MLVSPFCLWNDSVIQELHHTGTHRLDLAVLKQFLCSGTMGLDSAWKSTILNLTSSLVFESSVHSDLLQTIPLIMMMHVPSLTYYYYTFIYTDFFHSFFFQFFSPIRQSLGKFPWLNNLHLPLDLGVGRGAYT